ncbi:hypothetical protein AVEN_157440-1, partial [Araneus ventricosus]
WVICSIKHLTDLSFWVICSIKHLTDLPFWMICPLKHLTDLPFWVICPLNRSTISSRNFLERCCSKAVDEDRRGRPVEIGIEETVRNVDEMIRADKQVTTDR